MKDPATLVTTADHDDRVVPAHSFKFAAQMQHCQAGDAPVLIRIESNAGHGAGKPTSKRIAEEADTYSFLFQNIGVPYKEVKKQKGSGRKPCRAAANASCVRRWGAVVRRGVPPRESGGRSPSDGKEGRLG